MKKQMKTTAIVSVSVTILMVVLLNIFSIDLFFSLAITFGTISYHFVMRLLVGGVIDVIMDNKADYNKKWYQLKPFEIKLDD